MICNQNEVK